MAITTPVYRTGSRECKATHSYVVSEFYIRARTTLRFIEQVSEDEKEFVDNGLKLIPDFAKTLNRLKLANISKILATTYEARIVALHAQRDRLRSITPKQWSDLLSDPVFAGSKSEGTQLGTSA